MPSDVVTVVLGLQHGREVDTRPDALARALPTLLDALHGFVEAVGADAEHADDEIAGGDAAGGEVALWVVRLGRGYGDGGGVIEGAYAVLDGAVATGGGQIWEVLAGGHGRGREGDAP